jgi:hypothetical protein
MDAGLDPRRRAYLRFASSATGAVVGWVVVVTVDPE